MVNQPMCPAVAENRRETRRPATVILVRHGETEANVLQVWHGALDAPLTQRGRRQVEAAGRGVADLSRRYPIDRFYVSPLARAQSTAAAIADAIDMTPVVHEGLREFDLGEWEGRTFQDLRESEDLWGRWDKDPAFAPPQGESPTSFNQRVVQTVQALAEKHPGETLLLVTHGGVICNVLATWVGDGPQDWQLWDPHNCAISVLQWDGEKWHALLINDISHLPPDAVVTQATDYATQR